MAYLSYYFLTKRIFHEFFGTVVDKIYRVFEIF